MASRDNFVRQFLSLIPWPLQRILLAGSASNLPKEKRDFLEFKGGRTVCLSVCLPVRQTKLWPESNYSRNSYKYPGRKQRPTS